MSTPVTLPSTDVANTTVLGYRMPRSLLHSLLWMGAAFTIIHTTFVGFVGDITNDFAPVYIATLRFIHHKAIYVEDLNSVKPHYLYPPSGTLLLSPLGYHNYDTSRNFLIIASVIMIILAILLLLLKIGCEWKSPIIPIVLILTFSTESVIHTLSFTNINGAVFFAQALFLTKFLDDSKKNNIIAGLALGTTFAIKPILLPLVILMILYRKYSCLVISIAVPIILNIIGLAMTVDGMSYFHSVVPYLNTPRTFYNSAILGVFPYFGINSTITMITRIFLITVTIITLYLIWRMLHSQKNLFSYSYAGITTAAINLLGPLGQGYYSIYIIPLLLTVFIRYNVVSSLITWIGAYLCLSFGPWQSHRWLDIGNIIDFWRIPAGWALILLGIAATVFTHFYLKYHNYTEDDLRMIHQYRHINKKPS